jgi:hypothetical protein
MTEEENRSQNGGSPQPPAQPAPDAGQPAQPAPDYGQPPAQPAPDYGQPPAQPGPYYGQPGQYYAPPPAQPGQYFAPPPAQPGPYYGQPPVQPGAYYGQPPAQPGQYYAPPPAQPGFYYGQPPVQPGQYGAVGPAPASTRSRRLRWAIAGVVVLAVIVAAGAGAFVLSGASGSKSLTAAVAPKNTAAFLEMRTDLPGDQHAKLADFMSHFPGFADRAQFDNALDETLNRLTRAVSPDLSYSSAFKPWMEGEVSLAVMDVGGTNAALPSTVAIVALKDRSAAQSWVTSEVARLGATSTSQSYAGITLYLIGTGSDGGAYAFTDQDLLIGTVAGVKAAVDSKTNGSLAQNANYQAAMNALSGDSLARFYVDYRSLLASYMGSANSAVQGLLGSSSQALPTLGISPSSLPAWMAGSVRAESDHLVVNVAMPATSGSGGTNHVSSLAPALPGTTVGVLEIHSIGKLVTDSLSALEAESPATSDSIDSVRNALALIGGVDWLGDGVAVVTKNGADFGGGIVVQAPDASTATSKLGMITAFANLAGAGSGLTTNTEKYKGVDIKVMSLDTGTGGEPIDIAMAAKGNMIVAGYTDTFVKAVIDTTSATALSAQPDYSAVMAAVGSSNMESFYVNIPALEDQIGQAMFSSEPSTWTTDYKPYFDHLGSVGFSDVGGNTVILRLVVMAR